MALNTCKMWSNGVRTAFFSKNYEKSRSGWGLRPQTPSMIRLNYKTLLYWIRLPIYTFLHFLTIGLSLSFWTNSWLHANTRPRLLIFHSTISLPPQKIPLLRFLMTALHVICGLAPHQSKILATPMPICPTLRKAANGLMKCNCYRN